MYAWTTLYAVGDEREVPLTTAYLDEAMSVECDFCSYFEISPCKVDLDPPVSYYDCSGTLCPLTVECNAKMNNPDLQKPEVTDSNHTLCPQAQHPVAIYKGEVSASVILQEPKCYNFINFIYSGADVDYTLNGLFYMGWPDGIWQVCDRGTFPCQLAWLDYPLTDRLVVEIVYNYMSDCVTFSDRMDQSHVYSDQDWEDPCIAYYDQSTKLNCAMCKIGSARMIVENPLKDGVVLCGQVRYPDRNSDGSYTYLRGTETDDIYDTNFRCYPHRYYKDQAETADLYEYIVDEAGDFYPFRYFNITEGGTEVICSNKIELIDPEFCDQKTLAPSADYISSIEVVDEETGDYPVAYKAAFQSLGCHQCTKGYIPVISFDGEFGIYIAGCEEEKKFDYSKANVPCKTLGYTQQWTGYIEAEKKLTCERCSDYVFNCEVCKDSSSCDLCPSKHFLNIKIDDDGVERRVCQFSFCGISGYGSTCSNEIEVENCEKSSPVVLDMFNGLQRQTCDRCSPGYYSYQYYFSYNNRLDQYFESLVNCAKQEGKIERNFFVESPNLSRFFKQDLKKEMYAMHMDYSRGLRWDDPFYFIQNVFALFGDQQKTFSDLVEYAMKNPTYFDSIDENIRWYNKFDIYEEVVINVWLTKGVHHFVQCQEHLGKKYEDILENEHKFDTFQTLCKSLEDFFPLKNNHQVYDNVKYYVRALECKHLSPDYDQFASKSDSGEQNFGPHKDFYDKCVDLEAGDPKPQVRVHGRAAFNITNFARFENIEFVGIDGLAQVTDLARGKSSRQAELYQDLIDTSPIDFCSLKKAPTGHLEGDVVENVDFIDPAHYGFSYSCGTGFAGEAPPQSDQSCYEDFVSDLTEAVGPRACQGETYHKEFFRKTMHSVPFEVDEPLPTKPQQVYLHRHKVLFNLYAFDATRSDRDHTPTLELVNCDFSQFFDKQALIQVETNNLIEMGISYTMNEENFLESYVDTSYTKGEKVFIAHLGEDRGAQISIIGSTFKDSRFCKGLLFYREAQKFDFDTDKPFFRFSNQVSRDEKEGSARTEKFILIENSSFENLAYQQTLDALSGYKSQLSQFNCRDNDYIDVGNLGYYEGFGCAFEPNDNLGYVVNAKGFSGAVVIRKSTFERNMAYIKDYLIQEKVSGETSYEEIGEIHYSEFQQDGPQVYFKTCDMENGSVKYLSQEVGDPDTGFDDASWVRNYESVSTIMLIGNKGPIVVQDNLFTENAGTIGGAIHILSPDFTEAADGSSGTPPYIVFDNNRFLNNTAYFAGNAYYIAHTVKRQESFVDYLNTCGAGVQIQNNIFEGNTGLKRHNGGAAVHRCLPILDSSYDRFDRFMSSWPLQTRKKANGDADNFKVFYEDPATTKDTFVDPTDSHRKYHVLKYGTQLINNSFERNYAGMKGSAVLVSHISEFQLIRNSFFENGPVTTFTEETYSPIAKYFNQGGKHLTKNFSQRCALALNELDYFQECQNPMYDIDMPPLQGAVYVENCEDDLYCTAPIFQKDFTNDGNIRREQIDAWITDHQVSRPHMRTLIEKNVFDNNQLLPVLQTTQSQVQASSLYIRGGHNVISKNAFINHHSTMATKVAELAPAVFDYMPSDYFDATQGSIIYVEYAKESSIQSNFHSQTPGTASRDARQTIFSENDFANNTNVQVAFVQNPYQGALINVQSHTLNSLVVFESNIVSYNSFIGEDSALIVFNGGLVKITNNTLQYNGFISGEVLMRHPRNASTEVAQNFFKQYSYQRAQEEGIFALSFLNTELLLGDYHKVDNNRFAYNFCLQGCAYSLDGNKMHQISFKGNHYEFMISASSGAVLFAKYQMPQRQSRTSEATKMLLHLFEEEQVSQTRGGAFHINDLNEAGYSIFRNCTFMENLGTQIGSIALQDGGSLIAIDVTFEESEEGKIEPEELHELKESLGIVEDDHKETSDLLSRFNQFSQLLNERLSAPSESGMKSGIEQFIVTDRLSNLDRMTTEYGQVILQRSGTSFTRFKDVKLVPLGNISLSDFIEPLQQTAHQNQGFGLERASVFSNCVFKNLVGKMASAISFFSSEVAVIADKPHLVNFDRNVSPAGTTIYGKLSKILLLNVRMEENYGLSGGCLMISTSELKVINSNFTKNASLQGGVIFAIKASFFRIEKSTFIKNFAQSGSLVYAMQNRQQKLSPEINSQFIADFFDLDGSPNPPLTFTDSLIKDNIAYANLVNILFSSMKLTNCQVIDNKALTVTHGFTLFESELTIESSDILFTDKGLRQIMDLSSEKPNTGVFDLYLTSKLYLRKGTSITNIVAQKQAVLSAIGLSSVYVSDDVSFSGNDALSADGYTLFLRDVETVKIESATFSRNLQTNIYIQIGTIEIANSTFTDGSKHHIYAHKSAVTLDNVTIRDSSDLISQTGGHGLNCDTCISLTIRNSNFSNLSSQFAPALYIHGRTEGTQTVISDSIFSTNTGITIGAVRLANAGEVIVRGSKFENNLVKGDLYGKEMADGGAIFYACDPTVSCDVILESNLFIENEAQRKGGALRYVNSNFTTVYQDTTDGERILNSRNLNDTNTLVDSNNYQGNKAAYGDNIASYPAYYKAIFSQHNETYEVGVDEQIIIAPGQPLDLKIQLFDQEGRLYNDENQAVCSIGFVDEQETELHEASVIQNPESVATNGTCTFTTLSIRQQQGTDALVRFSFTGLETFGNSIEAFYSPPVFALSARNCIQGESYRETLVCQRCEPGSFLYEPQLEPSNCDPCPFEANCYGGNVTAPKEGYWRSSPTSTNYLKCLNEEACLGGSPTLPLGECDTGYDGILCANCIGTYHRSGAFECKECHSPVLTLVFSSLYIVGLILAVAFFVKIVQRGAHRERPVFSVYMKIFMNYFQMLQVVSQIKFGWPSIIQQVLEWQRQVVTLPTEIIAFDCIAIQFFGENRTNYLRIITAFLMPIVVIGLSFAFWYLRGKMCRANITKQQVTDYAISTIAIVWFLFYPTIVYYLASSINCTSIEGKLRLYDDLEQLCYRGSHLAMFFTVSIPGLICWAFGMPILAFFLIQRARQKIEDTTYLLKGSFQNELIKRYKLRLSFLTQGYKDKFYYWETVLLLRKTILVILITFLAPVSSSTQSLTASIFLIGCLLVHLRQQPFYDENLNRLETVSLLVLILIIYFGLFYQAGKLDPFVETGTTKYSIFTLVTLVSICFIGFFLTLMRIEALKASYDKPLLFAVLSCRRDRAVNFKKRHHSKKKKEDKTLYMSDLSNKNAFMDVVYPENVNVNVGSGGSGATFSRDESSSSVVAGQQSDYDTNRSDQQPLDPFYRTGIGKGTQENSSLQDSNTDNVTEQQVMKTSTKRKVDIGNMFRRHVRIKKKACVERRKMSLRKGDKNVFSPTLRRNGTINLVRFSPEPDNSQASRVQVGPQRIDGSSSLLVFDNGESTLRRFELDKVSESITQDSSIEILDVTNEDFDEPQIAPRVTPEHTPKVKKVADQQMRPDFSEQKPQMIDSLSPQTELKEALRKSQERLGEAKNDKSKKFKKATSSNRYDKNDSSDDNDSSYQLSMILETAQEGSRRSITNNDPSMSLSNKGNQNDEPFNSSETSLTDALVMLQRNRDRLELPVFTRVPKNKRREIREKHVKKQLFPKLSLTYEESIVTVTDSSMSLDTLRDHRIAEETKNMDVYQRKATQKLPVYDDPQLVDRDHPTPGRKKMNSARSSKKRMKEKSVEKHSTDSNLANPSTVTTSRKARKQIVKKQ